MYHRLLGFDCRLPKEQYLDSSWPFKRRQTFLINPNIVWPLSVDRKAWPSIFSYYEARTEIRESKLISVDAQDAYQEALELWSNLDLMHRAVEESDVSATVKPILLAVEIFSSKPFESFEYWKAVLDESHRLAPLKNDWVCVGYDVADSYRLSSLTNCSYSNRESSRPMWVESLNGFGLFSELESAFRFVNESNAKVPEHAPFFAYGLYTNAEIGNTGK